MRWPALAVLVAPVLAVGCGAAEPAQVVAPPETIPLGTIGPGLAVDGEALVHVAYRGDSVLVVRRELVSGDARTLLRRPADPWSVEDIAAREGRVAVGMLAPIGHGFGSRVLDVSPAAGRPRVLRRASEGGDCDAKVSLHNATPAKAVLTSEVRLACTRGSRPTLVLRLHGAGRPRTILRRELSADRAGRLISDPVLYAGVGGGRMFISDPSEIELVELAGRRPVMRRSSTEGFAGAEINDHGDLLFHEASAGQFRSNLVPRGQSEPVVLAESSIERVATVRLCGTVVVRYAARDTGETELSAAPVTDPTQFQPLRAWPAAEVADTEVICDARRAVVVRRKFDSGPSSAEVVDLPR